MRHAVNGNAFGIITQYTLFLYGQELDYNYHQKSALYSYQKPRGLAFYTPEPLHFRDYQAA